MLQLKDIVKEYGMAGAAGNADSQSEPDSKVVALKGVSIAFRENEFVSILGQSGCGKTTMLNIIGGLDQYTSGDLIINGKSTKEYTDRDWDAYRNHSVGFVFQSYNLIPHQTVLANVELALTLSGVSSAERKERAIAALEKVGLGNQLKKKPNQMSGGQMQRVAIARALVNNPDILLADEPTGALDSETSVQIMDLLKEVAKDRLVIMVTHNAELAEQYSTRIVRLLDGNIIGDTNPYEPKNEEVKSKAEQGKLRRTSMKYSTAFSLSMNNLMTKKGRTFLTAFAGSIGIIGISLILSLSNGVQEYINKVQEDTLSSYPLSITSETMDLTSIMSSLAENSANITEHDMDKIYSSDLMGVIVNSMLSGVTSNNLSSFKEFLDKEDNEIHDYASSIQYVYDFDMSIYAADTEDGVTRVHPSTVFENMMDPEVLADAKKEVEEEGGTISEEMEMGITSGMAGMSANSDVWIEMMDDTELLQEQYDIVAGEWPDAYNELLLIADGNNEISDFTLYALGLRDQDELAGVMVKLLKGENITTEQISFTYEEIMNLEFKLVLPTDYYAYDEEEGCYVNRSGDEDYLKECVENGTTLQIVGIVRPNPDAVAASLGESVVAYTSDLTEYAINAVNDSEIVQKQKDDESFDVIAGLPFITDEAKSMSDAEKAEDFKEYLDNEATAKDKADIYLDYVTAPSEEEVLAQVADTIAAAGGARPGLEAIFYQIVEQDPDAVIPAEDGTEMKLSDMAPYLSYMTDEQLSEMVSQLLYASYYAQAQAELQSAAEDMTSAQLAEKLDSYIEYLTEEQLAECYDEYMPARYSEGTYEDNLKLLNAIDINDVSGINIYCKTFDDKDEVVRIIKEYNDSVEDEEDEITYTDIVALMMSSVSTIINAISYILIAFVAISLIVSSIMIGIITYISVLERTKEIGILRAIGASKKDISHVFNAETMLIGLTSGLIGITTTVLMLIPINIIIKSLTNISNLAKMPVAGAVILVIISIALTTIAGLFPAGLAAKKDPVEALRTE